MSSNEEGSNQTALTMYAHPTIMEYYANLTPFIILSIFISVLIMILNLSIFITTITKLKKRLTRKLLKPTTFLCSLYPLISVAAVTTILIPKSWLICHTVMHLSFTFGAVAFHKLCFRYVDSEVNYLKETDGEAVLIRTPPCCCCCVFLPAIAPSKAKLCILRYMIWQMPFVQGSIMLVLNGIYYKEPELYSNVMIYFIPFIISSILVGIWALNITIRMVNKVIEEYGMMKKLFSLQLILLLCKLQYLFLDSQFDLIGLGGSYPINHTIYKQTIINLLILVEMTLVSLLVQNAYRPPLDA